MSWVREDKSTLNSGVGQTLPCPTGLSCCRTGTMLMWSKPSQILSRPFPQRASDQTSASVCVSVSTTTLVFPVKHRSGSICPCPAALVPWSWSERGVVRTERGPTDSLKFARDSPWMSSDGVNDKTHWSKSNPFYLLNTFHQQRVAQN